MHFYAKVTCVQQEESTQLYIRIFLLKSALDFNLNDIMDQQRQSTSFNASADASQNLGIARGTNAVRGDRTRTATITEHPQAQQEEVLQLTLQPRPHVQW